ILIRKLARRLATKISRRYKQSSKIKRIDVRRSIRAGIKYGGALLDLKYRQKKVQKPEIILLCDVSGSMVKYSQFTLQFMSGLSEVLPRMQAFVFADTLEKLNLAEFSFDNLAKSNGWGEGTNLNTSLNELLINYQGLFKHLTVLIILSDTKTLQPELAAHHLKHIKQKVKDIIWLNPLPGNQWGKYPTVELFKKYSTMWECSSLAHLANALRQQLV
ncbi:MAG: VWA domain-containing protein, partial [Dehalobacterium sp.]